MKIPGKIISVLIVFFVLVSGYITGAIAGSYMLNQLLSGGSRYFFLLYRPADEYIFVMSKINSEDEMERISGYYSLIEYNMIDNDFLIERYKREKSVYIKRTIIWILGKSGDPEGTAGFLSGIYKNSSIEIKKEILRSIKRLDVERYHMFIHNNKIGEKILKYVQ